MDDQISQVAGSVQMTADAYKCIGVRDTSMPDGDVAAAFYTAYSSQRDIFNGNPTWSIKSLGVIADSRQSQLLAFVREMIPHLTKENVSILATKTPSAQTIKSSTIANFEATSGEPGFQILKSSTDAVDASPELIIFGALAISKPLTQGSATAVDTNDSDDGIASDQPDDASNFSSGYFSSNAPSSHYNSDTSQISEPAGGKFWNGEALCCKVCNEELNDEGECDDGHTINPCRYCGKEFEPLACSRFCIECHRELSTSCSICNEDEASDKDELTEAIQMVWDDKDNVWRCTTCMWEVEANSENEGQCQCTIDPEGFLSTAEIVYPRTLVGSASNLAEPFVMKTFLRRPIALLYYHEYDPADSDSSGEESVDSEPDSEDQWAIDDSESTDSVVEGSLAEVSEAVDSTTVQEGDTPTTRGAAQAADIDGTT